MLKDVWSSGKPMDAIPGAGKGLLIETRGNYSLSCGNRLPQIVQSGSRLWTFLRLGTEISVSLPVRYEVAHVLNVVGAKRALDRCGK